MMATKQAVALRAFTHAGESFAPGAPFPIEQGHLADWSDAGLVRVATADEVARAKGSAPRTRRSPSTPRGRKPKAAPAASNTASADTDAGAASTDPAADPAAPAA